MNGNKPLNIGVIMDPIENINVKKDSTFAIMHEAQSRGYKVFTFLEEDLALTKEGPYGLGYPVTLFDDPVTWFDRGPQEKVWFKDLDVIHMRSDPPVDKRYIHTTYILEEAEKHGALVVNSPRSLRDFNEKMVATLFPGIIPDYLVTADKGELMAFLEKHRNIIMKPLDVMGGEGIFLCRHDDPNIDVIFEMQTQHGTYPVVVQPFLEDIQKGDRRVLIFGGQPFDKVLVRIPQGHSIRGNMAAGGRTEVHDISAHDKRIADAVSGFLVEHGIYFAGLDIIGDYLIEINITSPTGLRQIAKESPVDPTAALWDMLQRTIESKA